MKTLNYEEWRIIPGYEGLYEISNLGNVRNGLRQPIKVVKNQSGYDIVWLKKDGFRTTFRIIDLIDKGFGSTAFKVELTKTAEKIKTTELF